MDPRIDALRETLARRDDCVAAWVFGSVARGKARADSDVDVAVLRGSSRAGTLDDLPTDLLGVLERACQGRVDLVVVDDADPDLVRRVLRDGILLLDRDRPRRIAFEVRKQHEYFDLRAHRELVREAALRRARGAIS